MQARYLRYPSRPLALAALMWGTPILVLAQAQGSPFMTGATALQTNILGFVERIEDVMQWCHGVIRWAGGDARREP